MRTAIILASLLLSTAAHANMIAFASEVAAVTTLNDTICPADRYNSSRLAVFTPRAAAEPSVGCWWIDGKNIKFEWFKLGSTLRPLNVMPRAAFENVTN